MKKTIGKQLLNLRRKSGLTQEALAEKLGVSPQAISKWEKDKTCPDIMLLPKIAAVYGVTVDDLFNNEEPSNVITFEKEQPAEEQIIETPEKFLRIYVDSEKNDNVKVSLPISVVKTVGNISKSITPQFGVDLSGVDFDLIFTAIESDVSGEIVTVTQENGDIVRVVIE